MQNELAGYSSSQDNTSQQAGVELVRFERRQASLVQTHALRPDVTATTPATAAGGDRYRFYRTDITDKHQHEYSVRPGQTGRQDRRKQHGVQLNMRTENCRKQSIKADT